MIEALLADLEREEGWRPHVYQDTLGYWTLGFGFLVHPGKGDGLPREVGEFWLRHKVTAILEDFPNRWPPYAFQPEDVQRALIQMAYQLGVEGVLGFKLMLTALERGDRETAAENVIASKLHQQTPARCERVARLIRGHD